MRLRLLLTSLVVLAVTASSFSYSTFARWTSLPVTFYVNPNNADVSSAAAIAAVQTGLNVWNTAGSPFRYVYGGTASDTATAYDNRNVLFFRNASNGSTIATTYSWWDSSNHLLDSDIIVWDGGFTFYTGTSGCGSVSNSAYLEDIATHELGHALGLNHSASGDATMYPSYGFCSQEFRTLAADDIAAIRSLYGSTGGSSNTAPTVTITSPANGATYGAGAVITLAANASDAEDGNLSASVQWTDNGGSIGTGGSLQVTASGTGAHTYVAKVTDSGNLQGSGQVSITVTTATGASSPVMSSPAPGSTLAGSSQTFTWTAGNGISAYWLSVGTSVGANNLFDLGVGSSRTATVTGLPTTGGTIYVRLWWLAGSWGSADYTYTAANTGGGGGGGTGGGLTPVITTPSNGATLAGSSQTFTWTAGSGVSSYWLYAGTSAGANNLFDKNVGLSSTATVTGLPTSGGTVYVRLWWLAGSWGYADYTYTAANTGGGGGGGGGGLTPVIATPSAGATLTGSSQTFTWTAGSGASSYWLYLGRTAGGNDLFDQSMGSSLGVTAGGLPTDGRTIYARLWWMRNGAWEYADTTYSASR